MKRPSPTIKGILKTKQRQNWLKTRIKMQRGLCFRCGKPLNGDATLDHHIPLSKGGDDSFENSRAMHDQCNQKKADSLPDL